MDESAGLRIVYIGVVEFSYHCLEVVLENGGNVVGVVTASESRSNSDFRDLNPLAEAHDIPCHYFKNINDAKTIGWIRDRNPDIIFCWGISQLIKQELLSLAPMGVLGSHPALLPANRGRHPLIWALALGLKKSGLTFFFLDQKADAGPILSQKEFAICPSDDAANLYKKIKELASVQIQEFLPQLNSGEYQTIPQVEANANHWRKRSHQDGVIDWRMPAKSILNLVRALAAPYQGAEFHYSGEAITIWQAEEFEEPVPSNIEPGKIVALRGKTPVIKCYDGAVVVTKFEPSAEFVVGHYAE